MRRLRSVTAALLHPSFAWAGLSRLMLALLLLSSGGCAWLDAKQRQIIYRPTPGIPADFAGLRVGDQRYFVMVPRVPEQRTPGTDDAPQKVEIWWLPHADKNAPTLLYFHGTFRNLFQNLHKIESLRAAGFAVLAVEYRGWGLSTPITPSEQTILRDADVAWIELQRHEPRPHKRVLYGHSMGSGVAVDLASRLPKSDFGALILESAFTSFNDLAEEVGMIPRLLVGATNERFDSLDKMARVNVPLLMLHGSADNTIPLRQGEKLFAAANPPKQWRAIEGGDHSDLDLMDPALYRSLLQAFMNQYLLPSGTGLD
jgi:pimeloyl-ACP methyl ester carboxylesterase